MSLDDAPRAYDMFKKKEDNCIKVVLKPHLNGNGFDGARNDSDTVVH
jgi:hypothetical protein